MTTSTEKRVGTGSSVGWEGIRWPAEQERTSWTADTSAQGLLDADRTVLGDGARDLMYADEMYQEDGKAIVTSEGTERDYAMIYKPQRSTKTNCSLFHIAGPRPPGSGRPSPRLCSLHRCFHQRFIYRLFTCRNAISPILCGPRRRTFICRPPLPLERQSHIIQATMDGGSNGRWDDIFHGPQNPSYHLTVDMSKQPHWDGAADQIAATTSSIGTFKLWVNRSILHSDAVGKITGLTIKGSNDAETIRIDGSVKVPVTVDGGGGLDHLLVDDQGEALAVWGFDHLRRHGRTRNSAVPASQLSN